MPAPNVLFELFNLSAPNGTGIATYARNLCEIVAELGYGTEALFQTNRPVDTKDAILSQVSFHDARNRKASVLSRVVDHSLRRAIGLPLGLKTQLLRGGEVVLPQSGRGNIENTFGRAYAAARFMDLSRHHFKRYGRRLHIRLPLVPSLFHATQAVPLHVRGSVNVYTVHDLVPLRLPYTTLDDKKFFYRMVQHLGRVADRIITVSETSRNDLIAITGIDPDKVVNTYQSVSFPPALVAMTPEDAGRIVESAFGLSPGGFFFFFGAIEPKKNVGRLVEAFLASGSLKPLVVAGAAAWEFEDDLAKIEKNKEGGWRIEGRRIVESPRIRRLDYVPLFQLVALIKSARAVIFPSLYEGFGLPVLESMLLGAPVVTSNVSALREVAGEAALLIDPLDVSDIMRAILRIESDDALCGELRAKGAEQAQLFSRERYKARIGKLYEDLIGPPRRS